MCHGCAMASVVGLASLEFGRVADWQDIERIRAPVAQPPPRERPVPVVEFGAPARFVCMGGLSTTASSVVCRCRTHSCAGPCTGPARSPLKGRWRAAGGGRDRSVLVRALWPPPETAGAAGIRPVSVANSVASHRRRSGALARTFPGGGRGGPTSVRTSRRCRAAPWAVAKRASVRQRRAEERGLCRPNPPDDDRWRVGLPLAHYPPPGRGRLSGGPALSPSWEDGAEAVRSAG